MNSTADAFRAAAGALQEAAKGMEDLTYQIEFLQHQVSRIDILEMENNRQKEFIDKLTELLVSYHQYGRLY